MADLAPPISAAEAQALGAQPADASPPLDPTAPPISQAELAQTNTGDVRIAPNPMESAGNVAKTFGENALSGYTLGGSEVGEEKLLGNAIERNARNHANPGTAMLGQGIGFGLAQMTPGYDVALDAIGLPAEAAAKAAGAGKVASSALAGAAKFGVMGGIQGALHQEASLGNPDINAGKLLGAAGMGAAYAAPFGLAGGLLKGYLSPEAMGALDEMSPEEKAHHTGEMSPEESEHYQAGVRLGAFMDKQKQQGFLDLHEMPEMGDPDFGLGMEDAKKYANGDMSPEEAANFEGAASNFQKAHDKAVELALSAANATEKGTRTAPLKPVGEESEFTPPTMRDAGAALWTNVKRELSNPFEVGKALTSPVSTGLSIAWNTAKDVGKLLNKEAFSAIEENLAEASAKIADSAKAVFGSGEFGAAVDAADWGLSSYEKNSSRIQELANDPNELMTATQNATKYMQKVAPQLSQQIQQQMSEGVNFLNSKIPKPINPQFLDNEWEPSKQQKIQFNEYYRTVDDPIATLKQIKNGGLTNQALETLQSVYPGLLSQMRSEVISNMDLNKASKMPFAAQIALSKFLGQPLSVGMTPQAIQANQQAMALQPQQNASPPKKSKGSSAKHLNQADRASTETTRDAEGT